MMITKQFKTSGVRGFTLLEVLISVVILGIGVIGIASLQITSSVYNESSLHRSHSSALARELLERMRANKDNATTGAYDITTLPTLTQNCEGASANCTSTELIQHDLRIWSARVSALLPGGTASVLTDTTVVPAQITITLQWTDRSPQGLVSQSFIFAL